jgi:hypothetical protein
MVRQKLVSDHRSLMSIVSEKSFRSRLLPSTLSDHHAKIIPPLDPQLGVCYTYLALDRLFPQGFDERRETSWFLANIPPKATQLRSYL